MDLLMDILSVILKCITAYIAITGALFLLPRKKYPAAAPETRFAILIPARNEETVIEGIIRNLQQQDYPREKYDIFVIPNNCTDRTEAVARRCGARILHCMGAVRTKGEVLHDIFDQLKGHYDAYCVFDADNRADPDFLARMNDAIAAGAEAAKGKQVASNPYESWVAGCYDLYFQNNNLLFNRPRAALGLSAKLIGTGFMITDSLLDKLGGWNTVTLTEDTELAAQCAMKGIRIHYVPEAKSYDEQPLSFRASIRQRRRWSSGVMSVSNRYCLRLLSGKTSWLRFDYAMFLSLIYVQLLVAIPAVYNLLGLSFAALVNTLLISLLSAWAGLAGTALLLCLSNGRSMLRMWRAVLMYPLFMGSWYALNVVCLFAKPKSWQPIIHLGREAEMLDQAS